MLKRTTIEIDEELLARAKRALGHATTRATVEDALRRATESAEGERADRSQRQAEYLKTLGDLADVGVLETEQMWR